MKKNNFINNLYKMIIENLENETLKKLFKEKIDSNKKIKIDEELRYISGILAHVPISDNDFKILQMIYEKIAKKNNL